MNCFLVDYESVGVTGFKEISSLSEEDAVFIFYSARAENMTFALHRRLNESKAEISFHRVPGGSKNTLDFQLCTHLGYLICQNAQSPAAYYIVSGDKNYETLSVYWKRHNVSVSLIPTISAPQKSAVETDNEPSALILPFGHRTSSYWAHRNVYGEILDTRPRNVQQTAAPDGDIKTRLKAALPTKYHAQIPVIAEIIQRCKTKQDVYGEVVRAFHEGGDNRVSSEIYQSIKPLLTDKT